MIWSAAARHSTWSRWRTAISVLSILFLLLVWLTRKADKWVGRRVPIDLQGATQDLHRHVLDEHGFLPLPASQELCASAGWHVHTPRHQRRKVYDLVLLNSELDWLEIRLHELHASVDYFVVVESARTFTNLPKPLHLADAWPRFAAFHSQIIYHRVLDPDENSNNSAASAGAFPDAWAYEFYQRDAALSQVLPALSGPRRPQHGDVLIVADVDEIPRSSTVALLRHCAFPRRLTLRSAFYYYSFQWRHVGAEWEHPQATFYTGAASTLSPTSLRLGTAGADGGWWATRRAWWDKADLRGAAWHCSSCFSTLAEMQRKMAAFSHAPQLNRPEFSDPAAIVRRVRNGLDLFDRSDQRYERVSDNEDLPGYLRGRRREFAYLLDRDPEGANFKDCRVAAGGNLTGEWREL